MTTASVGPVKATVMPAARRCWRAHGPPSPAGLAHPHPVDGVGLVGACSEVVVAVDTELAQVEGSEAMSRWAPALVAAALAP